MGALLFLLCAGAFAYQLIIIAAMIVSWFPVEPGSALESGYRFLHAATAPVLGPIRRALPPVRLGGLALDLSPLIVLVGLWILRSWVFCRG